MDVEKENLHKLYQQRDTLIVQIASVSIPELLSQCRDEYLLLEEKIRHTEDNFKHFIFRDMVKQQTDFCLEQYEKAEQKNIIEIIEITNNIDLMSVIQKYKLRIPKTLNDRRLLLQITNVIGKNINIKDIEGYVLDRIGKQKKSISVFVNLLSRLNAQSHDNVDYSNIEILIPKSMIKTS